MAAEIPIDYTVLVNKANTLGLSETGSNPGFVATDPADLLTQTSNAVNSKLWQLLKLVLDIANNSG